MAKLRATLLLCWSILVSLPLSPHSCASPSRLAARAPKKTVRLVCHMKCRIASLTRPLRKVASSIPEIAEARAQPRHPSVLPALASMIFLRQDLEIRPSRSCWLTGSALAYSYAFALPP